MNVRKLSRRAATLVLGLVLALPVVAVLATALLDHGPERPARPTLFPAALTLLDPIIWDGLLNSLLIAALVTLAARRLGVGIARVLTPWRYWGRGLLAFLVLSPAVVPPAFLALGLRSLGGHELLDPLTTTRLAVDSPWNARIAGAWLALIWSELPTASALMALAVIPGLRRIDPSWTDSGGASGARPGRLWRELVRPLLRPTIARASAWIFGLVLFDPGAPLALGLRRTFAHQIVQTVQVTGPPARVATLLLLGLAWVLLVAGSCLWLGGNDSLARRAIPTHARSPRASWKRGPLSLVGLAVWASLAWLPVLALFSPLWSETARGAPQSGAVPALERLVSLVRGPGVAQPLLTAGAIGVLVSVLALASTRFPACLPQRKSPRVPPLALAGAWLCVPELLRLGASSFGGPVGNASRHLARWLDPLGTPGLMLVLVLVLLHRPIARHALTRAQRRLAPALIEAAVAAGASPRRAWRDVAWPLIFPPRARAAVLIAALAASHVATGVVLAPLSFVQTLGATVLTQYDQPGGERPAAWLAAVSVLASVGAFAFARRDEPPLVT